MRCEAAVIVDALSAIDYHSLQNLLQANIFEQAASAARQRVMLHH